MLGGGAFCNGQKIHVSQTDEVSLKDLKFAATPNHISFGQWLCLILCDARIFLQWYLDYRLL